MHFEASSALTFSIVIITAYDAGASALISRAHLKSLSLFCDGHSAFEILAFARRATRECFGL